MEKDANILVTGGSGMLGTALKKVMPNALYPPRYALDIVRCAPLTWISYFVLNDIEVVFHGAAFTSPPKVDQDPGRAVATNIKSTANLVSACMSAQTRLVYMSTDYVFDGTRGKYGEDYPVYPVNKYAWSKLGGECAVRMYDNSLIIRTNMCPEPFPYEKAFTDQITTRDYISDAAPKIVELIKSDLTGTIHIGGKRQRIYSFARQTRPDVQELLTSDVSFKVPHDVSLMCDKWERWKSGQKS